MRRPHHTRSGEHPAPADPDARSEPSGRAASRENAPQSPSTTAPGAPWPAGKPVNHAMPDRVPTRPQGDRPVIAHLVWDTHEELIPGRAIRWTATHVMVLIKALTGPPNQPELIVWLPAHDVYASIPRRPRPGAPPTS